MSSTVPYNHLWSPERLTSADLQALLSTAALLKRAKSLDRGWGPLRGRHLALLCSGRGEAAAAFERAVTDLGATASLLNADEWRMRAADRVPEAARLLGRLYDAIDCCDLPADVVAQIELHSGVPVFNGLTASDHPLGLLGELLTMHEAAGKPLHQSSLQFSGTTRIDTEQPVLEWARLARLAGLRVVPSDQPHTDPPSKTANEPDFILDTSLPASATRLSRPHDSLAQQAELVGLLRANRLRSLQAAIVCGLQ